MRQGMFELESFSERAFALVKASWGDTGGGLAERSVGLEKVSTGTGGGVMEPSKAEMARWPG